MSENPRSLAGFLRSHLAPREYLGLQLASGALLMIGASWIFGVIAVDVVTGAPLVHLDTSLAMWLHRHSNAVLTQVMLVVTHLHGMAATSVAALVIGAWLFWKKYWYWLLALAVSVPGGMLLNVLLKLAYHRVRPSFEDPLLTLATYSFPSGHAAASTVLYGFLAAFLISRCDGWRARAAIGTIAVLLIALVGFSRIYLGVHYLSDVLAAVAASIAWLALCLTSVDTLRRRRAGRRLVA